MDLRDSAQRTRTRHLVGAGGGGPKRNALTRFDAFVLIVTDTGRPSHVHTDGYDGFELGLNRSVNTCMGYR